MQARERKFRKTVLDYYRHHGRHALPWRKTHDPYKILVSELMLQQTQVERVIPFYERFLKKYPTARRLAAAPLGDVLLAWQGLGYNRRAKLLQQAAKLIQAEFGGVLPRTVEQIESLPGVGPYTARAIAVFAFNHTEIVIETNIRTAVMHHFFPRKRIVSDTEIETVLTRVMPKSDARIWYSALMDYGASLKRSGVRTNARVKGYAKQTKFDGSLRQARGAALRALSERPLSSRSLTRLLGKKREPQVKNALASLLKDELVELRSRRFRLPS